MSRRLRPAVATWFGVAALVASACAGASGAASDAAAPASGASAASGGASGGGAGADGDGTSSGCEAGRFYWEQPGCDPARAVDLDEIIPGGPPPDGIPPIDDPSFESVDAASSWLREDSPVMVVELDGEVKAYPLAILTWHEIVNDRLAGVPIVVTYCPLCNSGLAFRRTVTGPDGEETLDFGTSGRLYRSNLVMYDRRHRNLWAQFTGEGIVGERFLGVELPRLPTSLLGFAELAATAPDAQVLSRDTGFSRDYGRNPYAGYDSVEVDPFLYRGPSDDRFAPMTRLVGLEADGDAVAVVLDHLRAERVVTVELAGGPVSVWWAPGQASALERSSIDAGRDVGQTVAFRPVAPDGGTLTFSPAGPSTFVDAETGSTWDLRGRAVAGPLQGERLEAVPRDDTFWFVWFAFVPDTRVVGRDAVSGDAVGG